MSEARRYEDREIETSDVLLLRYPGIPDVLYQVWDTKMDMLVPFGSCSTRERAERRAAQLEEDHA